MRCFLAVPLRPPALDAAQRTLAQLREHVADVRWARPETLHLTLHFFGAIDDARLADALAAVQPVIRAGRPFEATIDTLGAFPERGWPRVLWLGGSRENAALTALADAVNERLRAAAFAIDERPFHPHATLGRPRAPWSAEARGAWRHAVERGVPESHFTADRVVLFESVTGREAARYAERAVLLLGGA